MKPKNDTARDKSRMEQKSRMSRKRRQKRTKSKKDQLREKMSHRLPCRFDVLFNQRRGTNEARRAVRWNEADFARQPCQFRRIFSGHQEQGAGLQTLQTSTSTTSRGSLVTWTLCNVQCRLVQNSQLVYGPCRNIDSIPCIMHHMILP